MSLCHGQQRGELGTEHGQEASGRLSLPEGDAEVWDAGKTVENNQNQREPAFENASVAVGRKREREREQSGRGRMMTDG